MQSGILFNHASSLAVAKGSSFIPRRAAPGCCVLLRRAMITTSAVSLRSNTDGAASDPDEEWGSKKLRQLADYLRQYRPPRGVYGNFLQLPPPAGVEMPANPTPVPSDHGLWWQRAGVLLCLFLDDKEQLKVILTKRTSTLSSHSGEVALPGGKRDRTDTDDIATALREAHEEIGLEPSLVKVVTQLEPFMSKLQIRIAPVIALLPHREKFTPRLNEAEVASIFEAPLEMFLKDENHRVQQQVFLGMPHLIHFFEFDYHGQHYLIWGATAAILIRAATVVFRRPPEFGSSGNSSKL